VILAHIVHVVVPVHSLHQGEGILHEVQAKAESIGFPPFGLAMWQVVCLGIAAVVGMIAYSVAGKGSGSHAGREEVRRAYRRKLAQEMAKDDAAKIRKGEKPRRRWMQW
jgi:hypothetical protein